jgi:uncharacterized protein
MKLHVDRLKDSPTEFLFEETGAWRIRAEESAPELGSLRAAPFHAVVRAHRMGQDVYIEGELTGALEPECGRCLVRYRAPLREPFRLVLEPAGARVPAEPESARSLARRGICVGDELEMGWYQGHEIDLSDFLLEMMTLALPLQPLCKEDCRGLCPGCGADRNAGPCGCDEQRARTPFAVLAALKGREPRGES